jgi:hypothetical protein
MIMPLRLNGAGKGCQSEHKVQGQTDYTETVFAAQSRTTKEYLAVQVHHMIALGGDVTDVPLWAGCQQRMSERAHVETTFLGDRVATQS